MRHVIVLPLLLCASAAVADVTPYAGVGVSAGFSVGTEEELVSDPDTGERVLAKETLTTAVIDYRLSGGLRFAVSQCARMSVGLVIDATQALQIKDGGFAVGAAAQLDWRILQDLQLGPRVAYAPPLVEPGYSSVAGGHRAMLGAHASTATVMLGVDVIAARSTTNATSRSVGVLAGASLIGRPSRRMLYGLGIGAVLTLVIATVVLSQVGAAH